MKYTQRRLNDSTTGLNDSTMQVEHAADGRPDRPAEPSRARAVKVIFPQVAPLYMKNPFYMKRSGLQQNGFPAHGRPSPRHEIAPPVARPLLFGNVSASVAKDASCAQLMPAPCRTRTPLMAQNMGVTSPPTSSGMKPKKIVVSEMVTTPRISTGLRPTLREARGDFRPGAEHGREHPSLKAPASDLRSQRARHRGRDELRRAVGDEDGRDLQPWAAETFRRGPLSIIFCIN